MIGKVTNYFQKIGVAEVLIESGELHPGDEVLITGPTSGVVETVVTELRDDAGKVDFAGKQMLVAFKVPVPVRRADKLYKWIERSSNG
jgi:putative protease